MKTISVEDLCIISVLTFCENAAELGCPKDKEVDMWFRELLYKEQVKVAEKMIEILDRSNGKFSEENQQHETGCIEK